VTFAAQGCHRDDQFGLDHQGCASRGCAAQGCRGVTGLDHFGLDHGSEMAKGLAHRQCHDVLPHLVEGARKTPDAWREGCRRGAERETFCPYREGCRRGVEIGRASPAVWGSAQGGVPAALLAYHRRGGRRRLGQIPRADCHLARAAHLARSAPGRRCVNSAARRRSRSHDRED